MSYGYGSNGDEVLPPPVTPPVLQLTEAIQVEQEEVCQNAVRIPATGEPGGYTQKKVKVYSESTGGELLYKTECIFDSGTCEYVIYRSYFEEEDINENISGWIEIEEVSPQRTSGNRLETYLQSCYHERLIITDDDTTEDVLILKTEEFEFDDELEYKIEIWTEKYSGEPLYTEVPATVFAGDEIQVEWIELGLESGDDLQGYVRVYDENGRETSFRKEVDVSVPSAGPCGTYPNPSVEIGTSCFALTNAHPYGAPAPDPGWTATLIEDFYVEVANCVDIVSNCDNASRKYWDLPAGCYVIEHLRDFGDVGRYKWDIPSPGSEKRIQWCHSGSKKTSMYWNRSFYHSGGEISVWFRPIGGGSCVNIYPDPTYGKPHLKLWCLTPPEGYPP